MARTQETTEVTDACDRYLARLGCVLWGCAFDVVSADGRREAAEWLAQQVRAVQAETANSGPSGVAVSSARAGEPVGILQRGKMVALDSNGKLG